MANRLTAKEHCPIWCCGEPVRRSRQIMRKRENEAWRKYEEVANREVPEQR